MKLTSLTVGSKEFDEIAKHITNTYPNACIMFIDKVESPPLEKEYNELKASLQNPNERLLFHGTTESSANGILEKGYDPQMNHRSAYGKGTYFSSSANVSIGYTDVDRNTVGFEISYMLINNVLVGNMVLRSRDHTKKEMYYTTVDSVVTPTIFCVPRKEQAIPLYYVGFHKGALVANTATAASRAAMTAIAAKSASLAAKVAARAAAKSVNP